MSDNPPANNGNGQYQPPPGYKLIADGDLNTLQRSYGLLSRLWDDQNVGAPLKQRAKELDPSLRIPEIDVAEPLLKPIRERQDALEAENKALREQMETDRTKRADDQALVDLQGALTAAQRKHRLTDEAMAEVRKIMAEKGVADPEIAAQYVVANIEPAAPVTGTNFGPSDANIFKIDGTAAEEDIKALHNDPVRWLDRAVPEIMAEFENEAA